MTVNIFSGDSPFGDPALAPKVEMQERRHLQNALFSFHWLRSPGRITFNLAVVVYQALHGTDQYLSVELRMADLPSKSRLRSSNSRSISRRLPFTTHHYDVSDRWTTTLKQSILKTFSLLHHCQYFAENWNFIISTVRPRPTPDMALYVG